jgi:hypothetical protein
LLFIDKAKMATYKDPWATLVNANQEDVNLVTIAGEPVYGDGELIQNVAKIFRDPNAPEFFPRDQKKCGFVKGIRMPWYSAYDRVLQEKNLNLRTVAGIESELRGKMGAYAQQMRASKPKLAGNLAWLDPIFNCEDDYYRKEFAQFIESSLDQNRKHRPQIRSQYRLNDQWSPMKEPLSIEEDSGDGDGEAESE